MSFSVCSGRLLGTQCEIAWTGSLHYANGGHAVMPLARPKDATEKVHFANALHCSAACEGSCQAIPFTDGRGSLHCAGSKISTTLTQQKQSLGIVSVLYLVTIIICD